jgi:hypothetical protein
VLNRGRGLVNALPISQPHPPTQIDILAIHEKQSIVKAANLIEGASPNQRSGAGAPGSLAGLLVPRLRVLARQLLCFADADPGIGACTRQKCFVSTCLQFRIRIQEKQDLCPSLACQKIYAARETVVGNRSQDVSAERHRLDRIGQ